MVDIEEEVGEPWVARDEVPCVDEGDIKVGEEDAALYSAYCNFAYGTCAQEIDGIKDRSEEVQAYAGAVFPIGC